MAEPTPIYPMIPRPLDWMDEAVCAQSDWDLWFPDKGALGYVTIDGTREHRAKTLCRSCPALEPCREYAMADPSLEGIWGALSADERRALRRQEAS